MRSEAPGAKRVKEYLVRVYAPLPDDVGPHPAACDWLEYLRFRHADGPRKAARADAVVSLMPGYLGGAANFDQVARNAIRTAAQKGKTIEVWAIDRRSNCLEDDTGVNAGRRAGAASVAWDYYWHGREVDGKAFGGFLSPVEAAWLGDVGLEQTVRDWHAVNRAGLPSKGLRAQKLVCGGHSLGGPMTAAYAGWDFDRDPKTTADAGYRGCAAFVGFDTTFRIAGGPGSGSVILGQLDDLLGEVPLLPYNNIPPLVPENFQVPVVFGLAAYLAPEGTDALVDLPRTPAIDLGQRFLFSRNAVHFATNSPNIREFTVTNESSLAGIFDDNSAPLSFLRTSIGNITGGPVVEKNFPAPDPTQALPEDPDAPLYSWLTYRQVRDREVPLNSRGEPFTTRESEVTDLRQLARLMFEAPANFIEQYFPTRLTTDVAAAAAGDRGDGLADLRHEGIPKRPALLIQAGDSDSNAHKDTGRPFMLDPPNELPGSRQVVLPGYNHLDVTTAAWRQNDGRPEPSSAALVRFVLSVTD